MTTLTPAGDLPPLPEPDCYAILTPNGSRLVSPDEAKAQKLAYPLFTGAQLCAAIAAKSEVEIDAARYRWLQEHTVATGLSRWMGHHQFLDAAIDAAIAEQAADHGEGQKA